MTAALVSLQVLASIALSQVMPPAHRELVAELAEARRMGIPVSPAELQPPIPSAGQNAAPLYLRWQTLRKSGRVTPADDAEIQKTLDFRLPDPNVAAAMRIVADHRDVFDLIHRAAGKPACVYRKDWSLGPAVLFPELADMRTMARWLQGESGALARQGKPLEAVRTMGLGFCIARHCLMMRSDLHGLVAEVIDVMTARALARLLWRFGDTPGVAAEVRRIVARDAPSILPADLLRSQVVDILNIAALMRLPESRIRTMLGVSANAPGKFSTIGVMKALSSGGEDLQAQDVEAARKALSAAPGATMADWKRLRVPLVLPVVESEPPRTPARAYDRWVDENATLAIRAVRRIRAGATTSEGMLDATYDAALDLRDRLGTYITNLATRPPAGADALPPSPTSLACLTINNISSVARRRAPDRVLAENALLDAATCLFEFRAKHGALPERLGDAMRLVPRDPYDGKPVKYRREGPGFVLYTVGPTGKFDGRDAAARGESILRYPNP